MATIRRESHGTSIWAFILIALGVIWLLFQANIFSGENLAVLFRLWPLILIAFGLELLIGRNSRAISLLIGGGTVVVLLVLMLVGPSLGLVPSLDVQEKQIQEPLGDTTSAQLDLNFSVGRATVNALTDSSSLLEADLHYVGGINYNASGTQNAKVVSLSSNDEGFDFGVNFFQYLGEPFLSASDDANRLGWKIGLTTAIPLNLRLHGGVGDATVDLTGIQLTNFAYNNGVGNTTITLPAGESYPFTLDGGIGNTTVHFADSALTATIDGGVGNLILDIPDNAAVRLTKDGGLGSIHVPASFERTSGSTDGLDSSGVWQSANFTDSADNAIIINYSGGVGDLTLQ